ncbi:MAG: TylF/MycF family methyltransferase [Gammaproteobacteria bacterium]|nr:TylF/MycF family methyltransferase [Gammaproteobacteria bacterium]MDH5650855.1 TylF/MycF family methyltransferase [Gammaproteobacteria bacterium]
MPRSRTLKKILSLIGVVDRSDRKFYKKQFANIPDGDFYRPLFSPWHGQGYSKFAKYLATAQSVSVVSPDRVYVLYTLALQALRLGGSWYECGVYKGGTAAMLAQLIAQNEASPRALHLFDSFSGMPETDAVHDLHQKGDFADTSVEEVTRHVSSCVKDASFINFHKGFIPDTFAGREQDEIAFAHVDVDIYRAIHDCCEFIYPRLQNGGFIVFDDYGFGSCPGARTAVDEFFADKPEQPLVLPTGQALVFRFRY